MNDLEQATTDELITELHRRYPSLLISGLREYPGDETADERLIVNRGSILTILGLLTVARDRLLRKVREIEGAFDEDSDG
jgi:hypothetical protein